MAAVALRVLSSAGDECTVALSGVSAHVLEFQARLEIYPQEGGVPAVDRFVLNEAEGTLPEFLRDFERGRAKRVYTSAEFPDIFGVWGQHPMGEHPMARPPSPGLSSWHESQS
jgi:hypothetical protein